MIRFQQKSRGPRTNPPHCCQITITRRLADDMREMAFAGENVSMESLTQRGWPKSTIDRLGGRAVEMARRFSIRQVGIEARP